MSLSIAIIDDSMCRSFLKVNVRPCAHSCHDRNVIQGGKTTLTGKQLKAKLHSENVGIPIVTDKPRNNGIYS